MARWICFKLLTQARRRHASRAFRYAGNRQATRMAMIPITTSISIKVNARRRFMTERPQRPRAADPPATRSVLVRIDHLAVRPVGQVLVDERAQTQFDEPHRAVAEGEVGTAGVPAAKAADKLGRSQFGQVGRLLRREA